MKSDSGEKSPCRDCATKAMLPECSEQCELIKLYQSAHLNNHRAVYNYDMREDVPVLLGGA